MPSTASKKLHFCGTPVTEQQLNLIQQTVRRYPQLSRTELAATLCEFLGWLRPNGKPKTVECRQFLERLHRQQVLQLPERRCGRPKGSTTKMISYETEKSATPIECALQQLGPVTLTQVSSAEERTQWRSLVEQHHYLGHRVPFGAHLRYLIRCEQGILGCLQFSSPAWRMRDRDQWIGWDDTQRRHGLQHILCNSRFLILPWVQVPHLASHVLGRAARQVIADWEAVYGVTPWLLETLVDPAHYRGTCYRAANWIEVGTTSGRGREDRRHRRHGAAPKRVWLYPLHRKAQQRLCQGN